MVVNSVMKETMHWCLKNVLLLCPLLCPLSSGICLLFDKQSSII